MKGFLQIIEKNTTEQTRTKAHDIFKKGHVNILKQNWGKDTLEVFAEVQGTFRYQVNLSIRDQQLNVNCTCPYDWGGICKHSAAVLLELNMIDKSRPKKPVQKKGTYRETKTPYVLDYPSLDLGISLLEEDDNLELAERNSWHHRFDYEYQGNSLICKVSIIANPFDDDIDESDEQGEIISTVTLTLENKKLIISSIPEDEVESLSFSEFMVLLDVIEHDFDLGLSYLEEAKRNQLILKEGEKHGLSTLDQAIKYFEMPFPPESKKNLIKNKSSAPQILKGNRRKENNRELSIESLEIQKLELSYEKVEKTQLLYSLSYSNVLFGFYPALTMSAFVGKQKKNGSLYASGLKRLDEFNFSDLVYSQGDQLLVNKCNELSTSGMTYSSHNIIDQLNSDDAIYNYLIHENHALLKNIWKSLINQKKDIFILHNDDEYETLKGRDFAGPYQLSNEHEIRFSLKQEGDLFIFQPYHKIGNKVYDWYSDRVKRIHPLLTLIDNYLLLNGNVKGALKAFDFHETPVAVTASNFDVMMRDQIIPISQCFKIDFIDLPETMIYTSIMPRDIKKSIYLKELDNFILIQPRVDYDGLEVDIMDEGSLLQVDKKSINEIQREELEEQEFKRVLVSSHPKFENNHYQSFYSLKHEEFVADYWFMNFVEKCTEQGVEVFGINDLKKMKYSPYKTQIRVNASSGVDWFDLNVEVSVGNEKIKLKDVRKAIIAKEKYIKLSDGKLGLLPEEWVKRLENYFNLGKVERNKVKISKLYFNVVEEVFEGLDNHKLLEEIREKKAKLISFKDIKEQPLPIIQAELRDYQKHGYEWLHFLNEYGWGGILADDMGLGKTLQVITFLKSLVEKGIRNHLVIVPTSLIFNWQNEIEKFAPSLNYGIYYGSTRYKNKTDWGELDVMITSYGVLVSDFDFFKDRSFQYIVLDESQAIKNPSSKRYKAVVSLMGKNKLAMTGTPLENSTLDIYAQMTFVNPGFFVSLDHFRKNYAQAIDKNVDTEVAVKLNKMLNPFILRRSKETVATELPPKIEDVIYCEMGTQQRKVYDAFRNKYRNEILNLIETDSFEGSKLHVLQALTKLRQICDSPAILSDDESYGNDSVKIDELIQHVKEKTSNHKLLIFSQFVSMLSLVKKRLDEEGIEYAYLDGQTPQKQREQEVNEFQSNKKIRVFLISLKAGGTGLNLTAAEYVYLIDPWWNPAIENQAIDRCYRIGQEKKVIAYRMICKDTLEEKIMGYKSKKMDLADSLIKTEESMMKKIGKDDILSLFS